MDSEVENTSYDVKLLGSEKAAILVLSLNDNLAAEIMSKLDEREIQQLAGSASRLPTIDGSLANQVHQEFAEKRQLLIGCEVLQSNPGGSVVPFNFALGFDDVIFRRQLALGSLTVYVGTTLNHPQNCFVSVALSVAPFVAVR